MLVLLMLVFPTHMQTKSTPVPNRWRLPDAPGQHKVGGSGLQDALHDIVRQLGAMLAGESVHQVQDLCGQEACEAHRKAEFEQGLQGLHVVLHELTNSAMTCKMCGMGPAGPSHTLPGLVTSVNLHWGFVVSGPELMQYEGPAGQVH